MDETFKKLTRGTNFRSGPSSKTRLFKESEEYARFDEEFKVVDSSGVDFENYKPLESFSQLESPEEYLTDQTHLERAKSLSESLDGRFKIKTTTPIQKHVIPVFLRSRDIVAVAPTGSGKTLAYLIPILVKMPEDDVTLRCLILVPTVELVQQLKRECSYLTRGKRVRVLALEKTMRRFEGSVAVSTPLTLHKLMVRYENLLDNLEYVVLDESDKLLEEGYYDNVDFLMNHLKKLERVQKTCFSSVIQSDVLMLTKSYFEDPIHITIGAENVGCCNVYQELVCVTSDKGKLLILKQLITEGKLLPPILIFLQSVKRVNELYDELSGLNLRIEKFTKELNLKQRSSVIEKFRTGEVWILVCTDILCRGVNFKGVHSVVNYDLHLTSQVYINRVGRAGRGLKQGTSITFFTVNDFKYMNHIIQIMKLSNSPIPSYLLNGLSNLTPEELKKIQNNPPTRYKIGPIKNNSSSNDKTNKSPKHSYLIYK